MRRKKNSPPISSRAVAVTDTISIGPGGVFPSSAQRNPSTTPTIGLSAVNQPATCSGTRAARIGDRRDEQPELSQERDGVADVAVLDVQAPTAKALPPAPPPPPAG